MSLSGILPAASRRAVTIGAVVAAFAGTVLVGTLRAQQTAPPAAGQTPAAPACTAGDPLCFTTPEPRLVMMVLTAEAGDVMDQVITKCKEAIAKPDAKPEYKQQAQHWKVIKNKSANGDMNFFFLLDQVVPNVTYNPFGAYYASGADRTVVDPLLAKVNGNIKFLQAFPYSAILDMGGGGGH